MRRMGGRPLLVVLVAVLVVLLALLRVVAARPAAAPRSFDPTGFSLRLNPVVAGLRSPTGIASAGDGTGRLFVVEKAGTIRIVQSGALADGLYLDLRPIVGAGGSEQGLLGLAFHPRYAENGFFYVNYTNRGGDTVVARYQVSADPNVADPGTGAVILVQPQPYANHNGGHLVFGPDGYLWIGLGDGGSGGDPHGNAQNGQTLLGKMLRIDVDSAEPYAIPPDNPYAYAPDVRQEIWAVGLRNPWRYSFDRLTGDLYIADVGQNAYEEVDVEPAGSGGGWNYGWNVMEANHCFRASTCDSQGLVLPIAEYDHSQGCSITGGYVYRGEAFPLMAGAYFFGDYCSGRIWASARGADGQWTTTQLLQAKAQISSFGEDESGELYATSLGDGTVYQLSGAPR